jgi:hypothetical protein
MFASVVSPHKPTRLLLLVLEIIRIGVVILAGIEISALFLLEFLFSWLMSPLSSVKRCSFALFFFVPFFFLCRVSQFF